MQQTYSCPNCGYQVAFGTQFCGHCGNPLAWQQPIAPTTALSATINSQQQETNWFQRHLNWTWVLAVFFVPLILFALIGFIYWLTYQTWPVGLFDIVLRTLSVVLPILDLIVSGWVIKNKGRSLWWILLTGWLSPLWLGNKNR
ncbi:MAG: zinc-ribbon domain-containing protein [Chloroflexi bacterium]|nr:zinc-ribbon domain-containing protein [Chloroflexota bacterium]